MKSEDLRLLLSNLKPNITKLASSHHINHINVTKYAILINLILIKLIKKS